MRLARKAGAAVAVTTRFITVRVALATMTIVENGTIAISKIPMAGNTLRAYMAETGMELTEEVSDIAMSITSVSRGMGEVITGIPGGVMETGIKEKEKTVNKWRFSFWLCLLLICTMVRLKFYFNCSVGDV